MFFCGFLKRFMCIIKCSVILSHVVLRAVYDFIWNDYDFGTKPLNYFSILCNIYRAYTNFVEMTFCEYRKNKKNIESFLWFEF